MAVAHDAFSQPSGTQTGTFSWTHTPVGTPKGVLVFIDREDGSGDAVDAVTYGGVSLGEVTTANDSAGETSTASVWFKGSGLPTGAQTVQIVTHSGVWYAGSITVTASGDTATGTPVLLENDGTLSEQNVTDGSPGSNSVRYAGGFSGLNSPPSVGANSTSLASVDDGTTAHVICYETVAGQGSRPVGFSSGSSDDRAIIHIAVYDTAGGGTIPDYPPAQEGNWANTLSYRPRRKMSTGRGGSFMEYTDPSYTAPEDVTADRFAPLYDTVMRRHARRPEGGNVLVEVPVLADTVEHGWEFWMAQRQRRFKQANRNVYGTTVVPLSSISAVINDIGIRGDMEVWPKYYGKIGVRPKYKGASRTQGGA